MNFHRRVDRGRRHPHGQDLQEALSMASERPDLERLFERRVPLPDILRLAGREVSPGRVTDLLESRDLARELRKLLDQ